VSSTPDLHIAAGCDETDLRKLIDRLTRQDLAERVAELEGINSELRLRLDAIAQLSASSDVRTEQDD
jgi:hypothetical protein